MRGRLPLALLAILLGAVDTAAGIQEVVFLGILQSQTEALIVGSVGTVASSLLLAGGIALLVQSSLTDVLITSAAYVCVPVFLFTGVIKHYAAWPSTVVGIAFPLLLFFLWRRSGRQTEMRAHV
jgi:hypothetical protein